MAEQKKAAKTAKVGETVEIKEGGTVMRPDGSQTTVIGGLYVLGEPGDYVVDGEEIRVK